MQLLYFFPRKQRDIIAPRVYLKSDKELLDETDQTFTSIIQNQHRDVCLELVWLWETEFLARQDSRRLLSRVMVGIGREWTHRLILQPETCINDYVFDTSRRIPLLLSS